MSKKTKAHCNTCHGERNNEILFTEKTSWFLDEYGISGSDKYEMLKCGGCDRVILRHTAWFSEDPGPSVHFYPPAMFRKIPDWATDMSGRSGWIARKLLKEIYVGVQNNMRMLATMGVRALIGYVMIDSIR